MHSSSGVSMKLSGLVHRYLCQCRIWSGHVQRADWSPLIIRGNKFWIVSSASDPRKPPLIKQASSSNYLVIIIIFDWLWCTTYCYLLIFKDDEAVIISWIWLYVSNSIFVCHFFFFYWQPMEVVEERERERSQTFFEFRDRFKR